MERRILATVSDTRAAGPTADDQGHGDHKDHMHEAGHGHGHAGGLRGWVGSMFRPHSHDAADSVDAVLEASADGVRAVKVSLVALVVTAVAGAFPLRRTVGQAACSAISVSARYPNSYSCGVK